MRATSYSKTFHLDLFYCHLDGGYTSLYQEFRSRDDAKKSEQGNTAQGMGVASIQFLLFYRTLSRLHHSPLTECLAIGKFKFTQLSLKATPGLRVGGGGEGGGNLGSLV